MEVINKKQNGIALLADKIPILENFVKRLNERPAQPEVKTNAQANNSKYLPISFIQNKLDEVYVGLWNFEMVREQVVANEVIGVGVLEVFHPIAQIWIKRSGTGAVMIQQQKGAEITDISKKYKNTLVKDFPHLEAACLTSAAKKLGKMFGRDLNREFEDMYSQIYTEEINHEEGLNASILEMEKATTKERFKQIWDDNPALQSLTDFQKNYQYFMRKNIKP
jgi:hypothetical protein